MGEQAAVVPGPRVFAERVRPARPDELALLPAIEEAADELFARHGIGPLPPASGDPAELALARTILVAGEPVAGFARLEEVDGSAHLEQLSVHSDHARRGQGTALLRASIEWAAAEGYPAMTLCTFAHVPWNAPFYRRHGFVEVTDLSPGLRALRDREARLGSTVSADGSSCDARSAMSKPGRGGPGRRGPSRLGRTRHVDKTRCAPWP